MVDLSVKLKALRQQAGLTQKQLGERIGTTKATISYYELSERTPSPEMLIKLAGVFHVSTDYLLGVGTAGRTLDVSGLSEENVQLMQHLVDALRVAEN